MVQEWNEQKKHYKSKAEPQTLKEINSLEDEGLAIIFFNKVFASKYPQKKWVIDAGALQMMEPRWLQQLNGNVIVTPHPVEFTRVESGIENNELKDAI